MVSKTMFALGFLFIAALSSLGVSATKHDYPKYRKTSCYKAYKQCDYTFEGVHGLPTFKIGKYFTKPDVAFTPRIVSKYGKKLGVLNTNIPAQVLVRGKFIPIDKLHVYPPFTPFHFKPYSIVKDYKYGHKDEYKYGVDHKYEDEYKNKYEDEYKDKYEDEYKDKYEDEYKDKYEDEYKDKYEDEYKDKYEDEYKDKYEDGHYEYVHKNLGSGIGHQTFHGKQEYAAKHQCVRVFFSHIQVLDKYGNVVDNLNDVSPYSKKCVVFRTK